MPGDRVNAFDKLAIDKENRTILSLDGGGIRGILTLQLLKELERVAGIPCCQLFDMVAGTSTGGIIAALIATGHSADEIEQLYDKLVRKVFKRRSWTASRFVNPPQYTKSSFRSILQDVFGDKTLAQAASEHGVDMMVTSKDVAAGEETYFSCFHHKGKLIGTYKDVLLRAVVEATMSAPTYFLPLERFVDGGVTAHNNPVMAAILEAVQYGPAGKYRPNKLTVLSFGTGCRPQFVTPAEVMNPPGSDAYFWLQWLMTEAGDDASDMQTYVLRSKKLFRGLSFRRFQISLTQDSLRKLPNRQLGDVHVTDAEWIRDLTNEELAGIQLDNVEYFPVVKAIGSAMAAFIEQESRERNVEPFSFDLVDKKGKELLVSRRGDIDRVRTQLSEPDWIDNKVKP